MNKLNKLKQNGLNMLFNKLNNVQKNIKIYFNQR